MVTASEEQTGVYLPSFIPSPDLSGRIYVATLAPTSPAAATDSIVDPVLTTRPVHLLGARKVEGEQVHSHDRGFDALVDSWSRYKPAASQGLMQDHLS